MREAAQFVASKTPLRPGIGVVLGSGLGKFADSLEGPTRIPYREIPSFPVSTAIGHKGELVVGSLTGEHGKSVDIAVMSGRFHLYEGYSPQQVVSGIRLFGEMGIKQVVLTNAAGGINLRYAEGALVLISDHINLQGVNPLVGPNDDRLGPRFPDMSEVYSKRLRDLARKAASERGTALEEGVYLAVLGPSYETPAEIRFFKTAGADLVGMSTAAEAIAARHLGLEVLGISCVTNVAAGLSDKTLSGEEVLAVGARVSAAFSQLLRDVLLRMSAF
jgi:purine-nucleoside phosphorylase